MPALPVAEAIGVTKSYRLGASRVPAVRNVSLAVHAGELVALAGPSGSGKSTLLHLIGCLDRPDAGDIRLGELHVSHMPAGALAAVRRDRLGFVFQSFNLVPVLTARENVEYPLLLAGWEARIVARASPNCSNASVSATSTGAVRASCPVVSASASPSRAPWSIAPRWCSPT